MTKPLPYPTPLALSLAALGALAGGPAGATPATADPLEPVLDLPLIAVPNTLGVQLQVPKVFLTPEDVLVVVDGRTPGSVAVGAYYAQQRQLPSGHVLTVSGLPVDAQGKTSFYLREAEFDALMAQVETHIVSHGLHIEAIVFAWSFPYLVECQSLTSATALGFDRARYCMEGTQCTATTPHTYYDALYDRPSEHGMRLAMMLAWERSVPDPLAAMTPVIDRGVAADGTHPAGDGYFIRTTDANRSVRWGDFQSIPGSSSQRHFYYDATRGDPETVVGKANVLFYLTGDDHVADLDTNGYAPGAVADHLTSCGGALHRSCQMEITAWLQAGATASYGSVNEGCNFTSKFPRASVLVKSYFKGETLIESYWRSVNMVGQGLFIGEPLARPFAETLSPLGGGRVRLTVATLRRGLQYALQTAPQGGGAFQTLEVVAGDDTRAHQLDFTPQPGAVYRLVVLRPVAPSLALAITKRGPWQLIASGAAPGQQVRLFDAAGCPAGTNPRVATADASGQARFPVLQQGGAGKVTFSAQAALRSYASECSAPLVVYP